MAETLEFSMPPGNYKISFCTTCKGRLYHLRETLPENLKNTADYPNVEFVILDYDSNDGLGEWIKRNYQREIDSGKIRYARIEGKPHFHMAHAKNMAHRVATGDILCNLDADNIIVPGFAGWLNDQFSANPHIVVRALWEPAIKRLAHGKLFETGLAGRVALKRANFENLRGYDEKIAGWGGDDCNLTDRAVQMGLTLIKVPNTMKGTALQHDDASRTEHMEPGVKAQSDTALRGRHSLIDSVRRKMQQWTTERTPPPPANPDGDFGCGTVRVNFKEYLTLGPVIGSPRQVPEASGASGSNHFIRMVDRTSTPERAPGNSRP